MTTLSATKPTNPKDAIGCGKVPVHLWPNTATAMGSIGFLNGALKYGRANFRATGVRASIYYDAARRHLDAWFEGEECDPDDGVPHLAAALACLAIIVDAEAAGKLTDDRQVEGGYRELMDSLTPHVGRLKDLHKGRDPKHYTVADNGMAGDISDAQVHDEALTSEAIEEMLRRSVREAEPQPIWQQPHVVSPSWQRTHFPLGDEVMSILKVRRDSGSAFDDEEIAEMCRLAQSNTVTLPLT